MWPGIVQLQPFYEKHNHLFTKAMEFKSLGFDLALGNSCSIGRSLKDKVTLSGCLFTENDSNMALCKGFGVMLSPIRAARPRGRVASSLAKSLAAAMLDYREIRALCRI